MEIDVSKLKGTRQTRTKKKAFLNALENALCNVSHACKTMKMSRNTFYDWEKTDKYFKQLVDEISEINIDFAETKLMQQIRDNNVTSTIFFLKTKGRNRGYIERVELDNMPKSDIDKLSDEELEAEIQKELKRRAKKNGK